MLTTLKWTSPFFYLKMMEPAMLTRGLHSRSRFGWDETGQYWRRLPEFWDSDETTFFWSCCSGKFGKNLEWDRTTQYHSGNSWMALKWTKIQDFSWNSVLDKKFLAVFFFWKIQEQPRPFMVNTYQWYAHIFIFLNKMKV